ncbi:hypothetical protein ACFL2V_06770 [Pseudomonadota bacterium]
MLTKNELGLKYQPIRLLIKFIMNEERLQDIHCLKEAFLSILRERGRMVVVQDDGDEQAADFDPIEERLMAEVLGDDESEDEGQSLVQEVIGNEGIAAGELGFDDIVRDDALARADEPIGISVSRTFVIEPIVKGDHSKGYVLNAGGGEINGGITIMFNGNFGVIYACGKDSNMKRYALKEEEILAVLNLMLDEDAKLRLSTPPPGDLHFGTEDELMMLVSQVGQEQRRIIELQ